MGKQFWQNIVHSIIFLNLSFQLSPHLPSYFQYVIAKMPFSPNFFVEYHLILFSNKGVFALYHQETSHSIAWSQTSPVCVAVYACRGTASKCRGRAAFLLVFAKFAAGFTETSCRATMDSTQSQSVILTLIVRTSESSICTNSPARKTFPVRLSIWSALASTIRTAATWFLKIHMREHKAENATFTWNPSNQIRR